MKPLNSNLQNFVERVGLTMERLGAARTLGRILGLLLVTEEPLSLDDMTETLLVSKASVSTNARLCEQTGLVQRVSVPGDRRTYYEITPGAFVDTLSKRIAGLQEIIHMAEEGLEAIDESHKKARSRLEEMHDLYTFLGKGMQAALDEWKALKKER
jgi:DNA-binding transcriptional regulator GbsR (MarR family)